MGGLKIEGFGFTLTGCGTGVYFMFARNCLIWRTCFSRVGRLLVKAPASKDAVAVEGKTMGSLRWIVAARNGPFTIVAGLV